jgi:hypothetical protein
VALARLADTGLLDSRDRDVMSAPDELRGLVLDDPLLAADDGSERLGEHQDAHREIHTVGGS